MKAFLANLAVNVVYLAVLLASAGRWDHAPAWAYLAIGLLTNVLMRLALRGRPELARERARPGEGAKGWDRLLLALGALLSLVLLVVAGLDAGRFGWRPRLPMGCTVAGALLSLAGMAVFLSAMRENPYFSAVVRVQRDRGHVVCTGGPYRIVRHPGNAGMALGTLALPLLLRSAWSAIPALLMVAVLVERTRREDAALARELDGYAEYQNVTRYRLVPGIW